MWGVLQKKIKITGENIPGTVKPQTIWSFTVTGRGKSELIEKSPLQSITAVCCSQNQGQEMKDQGEPSQELGRAHHFPLQAEPKDPSSSGWGGGRALGQLSEPSRAGLSSVPSLGLAFVCRVAKRDH